MDTFETMITGLMMHAYQLVIFTTLISIPARMLFRAFNGKNPLR